jgi:TonB family protein
LRSVNPTLPRDLEAVIQRCLERDVLKRYDSAADLAADLDRFLAGAPVSVKPVSALSRLARRIRRNPLPFVSAAVIVALGCGWAVYALASRARERALGQRMQAQVADLERIRNELQGLRSAQAEERARTKELEGKVAQAATAKERKEAVDALRASQARARELELQVEDARKRAKVEPLPEPRSTEPSSPASAKDPGETPKSASSATAADLSFSPPQILKQAAARYPGKALSSSLNASRHREVIVRVLVQVDAQGRSTGANILEGIPGPWGYNEAALEAVSEFSYIPAQRAGRAVAGTLEVKVRFLPPGR